MTDKNNHFDKDESVHLTEKAETLADLYPNVSRILLFVAFEEADSESEPNYQQIIFTPDTEAVLHLDCSRDECVAGGFDFAPIIEEMVKNDESRAQGSLECQGTFQSDDEPCRLKCEYRIVID